jgi:hypothetical protein
MTEAPDQKTLDDHVRLLSQRKLTAASDPFGR